MDEQHVDTAPEEIKDEIHGSYDAEELAEAEVDQTDEVVSEEEVEGEVFAYVDDARATGVATCVDQGSETEAFAFLFVKAAASINKGISADSWSVEKGGKEERVRERGGTHKGLSSVTEMGLIIRPCGEETYL